jgi:hypothetical protein
MYNEIAPAKPSVATAASRTQRGAGVITKKSVAVLVLGMHRSGTSAFTGMLNIFGVDGPSSIIAPDEHNQAGYWESGEIAALNDEILDSAGVQWNDWEPVSKEWFESPKFEEYCERAALLVKKLFGNSKFFVLKDPRICRLLPFWRAVLESSVARVVVASPIRHPHEVAASLLKRNGMNPSVAQLIWLRHVLDAEFDSRELERFYFKYDDLLQDWRGLTHKLSESLKLKWPRKSSVTETRIDAFLRPTLRHNNVSAFRGPEHSSLLSWVEEAYSIFERWTVGNVESSDQQTLDRLRTSLTDAAGVFARPIAEHDAHGRYLKSMVEDAESRLTQRDEELAKARQAYDERSAVLEEAEAALLRRKAELSRALADLDQRSDALALVRQEFDEQAARLAGLQSALVQRDEELAQSLHNLEIGAAASAQLEASLTASKAELSRALADLAQRSDALALVRQEFDEQAARLAGLQSALVQRDEELAQSLHNLEIGAAASAQLEASLTASKADLGRALRDLSKRGDELEVAHGEVEAQAVRLAGLESALVERGTQLAQARAENETLSKRLAELDNVLSERNGKLSDAHEEIQAKVARIGQLEEALVERENEASQARQSIADGLVAIEELNAAMASRKAMLSDALKDLARRNHALSQAYADLEKQSANVQELERTIALREQELADARSDAATHGLLFRETARSLRLRNVEYLDQNEELRQTRLALQSAHTEVATHREASAAFEGKYVQADMLLSQHRAMLAEATSDATTAKQTLADTDSRLHETTVELNATRQRLASIENATWWRVTYPFRAILSRMPAVARLGRRALKLIWWTITLQLFSKLKERGYLPGSSLASNTNEKNK